MLKKTTELLSPAKNLECGLAAINHGADAVYIGASQFGARAAAGNSIEDIETLVNYAHRYRAKVFVALNTILTDNQLNDAKKLIHQLYNAGADALIVQDMGILKMNIPPIALHASTQTDNRTVEKVRFLQDVGFSRVVLARELSLKQIAEIKSQTNVELEAFVHGALCVSYSGQCYMSQAMSGRSANRGQCAQYCRLPYQLLDAEGNILLKNKHLLSLKDLDLSEHLEEMMQAGVMSFKIEGRLKSAHYVATGVKVYRQASDACQANPDKYSVRPEWWQELEKISHRPYTTGFYFGKPSEADQIYSGKSNVQTHDFVGLVRSYDKERKVAVLEQRNNFKIGDEVEFCQPDPKMPNFSQVISSMADSDGNTIVVAPHAQQLVTIPMNHPVASFAMMRRKVNPSD